MSDIKRQSIGKDKAIELAKTGWWESCTHREIAEFQLFTKELCLPFDKFHEAIEKTLCRPVWTHEFGNRLVAEFLGERDAPSLADIMNLIPSEKRCFVVLGEEPIE